MDAEQSLEALVREGRFLQRLAEGLLRDPHAAEDVVAEVTLRTWRQPPEGVRSLRAWLAGAVRRAALQAQRAHARRARHETLSGSPSAAPRADASAEEAELLQRVAAAVAALRSPYRETILARYFQGQSARELARAGGVPLATVRTREQRALAQLRERLDRGAGSRGAWAAVLARLADGPKLAPPLASLVPAGWVVVALLVLLGFWRLGRPDERALELGAGGTSELGPPRAALERAAPLSAGPSAPERSAQLPLAPEVALAPTWRGRTLDLGGAPLGGVELVFRSEREDSVARARSDAAGRFSIPVLGELGPVRAELDGHVLVRVAYRPPTGSDENAAEGEDLRVVLAPAGEVELVVLGPDGAGLAGVALELGPTSAEALEPSVGWLTLPADAAASTTTDAAGRGGPLRVPADTALALDVFHGERTNLAELRRGAEVVVERETGAGPELDARDAAPIVVEPGRRLALVLRFAAELRLFGELRLADGRLASDATLHVLDRGLEPESGGRVLSSAKPAGGRFELALPLPDLVGPIELAGWQEGTRELFGDASEGYGVVASEWMGERLLALDEARAAGPLVIELAERPTGLLAGRVLDAAGRALAKNAFTLLARARSGAQQPWSLVLGDGRFVLSGLEPDGRCDLVVLTPEHVAGHVHTFRDLRAGARELELRLPASSAVRVRLRFASAAAEQVAPLWVAHLAGAADAAPAPAFARIAADAAWPAGVSSRQHALSDAAAMRHHAVGASRAARGELELLLGEPGTYALGLVPDGGDDHHYRPLASAPFAFSAGEYLLEFPLVPTTALAGRVLGAPREHRLAIAVLAPDDRPRTLLEAGGKPYRFLHVQVNGRFLLRGVPLGRTRLALGRAEELAAGRPQRVFTLEVAREARGELVLEW